MESGKKYGAWYSGLAALFLIGALAAALSQTYRQVVNDLFLAFFSEEYSYLTVVFLVLVIVASTTLSEAEVLEKPRISRILVALIYFASSGILWSLSTTLVENVFVLRTASLVIFIWGLASLLYSVNGLKTLFHFLITLLFLIPIPRDFLEQLAVYLSKNVGYVASIITGSEFVAQGSRVYLNYGSGKFEIVYGCSGIVGLSSIVALTPLLLYVVRNTRSLKRKVLAVILGIGTGALVAYIGNVLRVSAIVWIARGMGADIALKFFHSTPSIIYASVATVASFIVASKIAKPSPTSANRRCGVYSNKPKLASLLLFFITAVTASLILLTITAPYAPPSKAELKVYSYDYIVSHMNSLAFSNKTKVLFSKPVPALTRLLGSSIVNSVRISFEGETYSGYVEFAETPARFHGWWVCLTYQGYKVLSMWRSEYNGTVIVYLNYLDKHGNMYLLAYAVYPVLMYFGGTVGYGYLRISLIKHVSTTLSNAEESIGKALVEGVSETLKTLAAGGGFGTVGSLVYLKIYYAILAVSVAYYALSYAYTGFHYLYRRTVVGRKK